MKDNNTYINQVKVEEIPWYRLTTPYGRANQFPDLFDKIAHNDSDAVDELTSLVEHQSTLWHSTPFAVIFVCRILKEYSVDSDIQVSILHLLTFVAEAVKDNLGYGMDTERHLALFSDMLSEEYLWSEVYDEEEDEIRYEDEPFPSVLFCSFYYFSLEVLRAYSGVFEKLEMDSNSIIRELAIKLSSIIKNSNWKL